MRTTQQHVSSMMMAMSMRMPCALWLPESACFVLD